MKLYEVLKGKFAACYILSLSNRSDRRSSLNMQFVQLGIDNSCFSSWIKYHYATTFPYNRIIIKAFNDSGKGKFSWANEYDCARNHYAIVKECLDLGIYNVLILEDDVCFINSVELLERYFSSLPSDYDVVQLGGLTTRKGASKILDLADQKCWVKHPNIGFWNASAYALSRKGMEYYINCQNSHFEVADAPLFKAPTNSNLNTYISTRPLTIQVDAGGQSNIRSERYDPSSKVNGGNRNGNVFESRVNINDYFVL